MQRDFIGQPARDLAERRFSRLGDIRHEPVSMFHAPIDLRGDVRKRTAKDLTRAAQLVGHHGQGQFASAIGSQLPGINWRMPTWFCMPTGPAHAPKGHPRQRGALQEPERSIPKQRF